MANQLILIRHPDKVGDKEGIYLGKKAGITKEGKSQIPLVIARLKLMRPDAVTCSFLPRAVGLAERIAKELELPKPVRSDYFNEVDKPEFLDGMSRHDAVHVEVMQAIRNQFDANRVPTELLRGERIKSRREMEKEIRDLFQFVERFRTDQPIPPNTVVAVSHAKKIAAILHYVYHSGTLKGYYKTTDRSVKISTAGISVLVREPDRHSEEMRWKLMTLNDITHLNIGYEEDLRRLIQQIS